jgi:outer membrane protein TolC
MSLDIRLTICALCGLLIGCATYKPKPLNPAQTASVFENRALTDASLKAFIEKNLGHPVTPWPPASWDFSLLSLAAFYYHPDLDVARAQWGVAKAGRITAGERPNPTLTPSPGYAVNSPPDISPWILGIALDIPIETAGKRGYRISQSKELSEAARCHIASVAWKVRSQVRASLVALSSASRSAAILRDQQAKLDQNRTLMEKRSEGGYMSPVTLTQAEVLAGKNQIQLQDAERQVDQARSQLAAAIGLTVTSIEAVSISTAGFDAAVWLDTSTLKAARDQALMNRSDILESLANYAASQSALQLEIAKQYPDLHLGPAYVYDQGVHKWVPTLAAVIPVLNQNRGPIAEAAAKREEMAARFIALQDEVIGDIERAARDYHAARGKLETANRLLTTHLEQEQQLRRVLSPGDVSRLTLFRSQLDIDSTRLLASDALNQFLQAVGTLEDALEHPLPGTETGALNAESNPRSDGQRGH